MPDKCTQTPTYLRVLIPCDVIMDKVSRTKARFETNTGEEVVIEVGDTVAFSQAYNQLNIPANTRTEIDGIKTRGDNLQINLFTDHFTEKPEGVVKLTCSEFVDLYESGRIKVS